MRRAFLFGLAAQLIVVGMVFLIFDDLIPPMVRSPVIGIVGLCLAVASGYLAGQAPAHPSWPVRVGLWIAGFLAIYAAIPVVELMAVLVISATTG